MTVHAALGVVALAVVSGCASPAEAATARCGGRHQIEGIDVSKWQGVIDWRKVSAAGVRFAFIRASDGSGIRDERFAANWRGARANGVARGAYQFFRPDQDPIAQADLLIEMIGPLARGDLPPVLDVEVGSGVSRAALVRKIERWVARVLWATGVRPIIYTSPKSWAVLTGDSRRFRFLPLWIAHYQVRCPATPSPWRRWSFHQRSDTGTIGGVRGPVDLNRFNGTARQLRRLGVADPAETRRRFAAWKRQRARLARGRL